MTINRVAYPNHEKVIHFYSGQCMTNAVPDPNQSVLLNFFCYQTFDVDDALLQA